MSESPTISVIIPAYNAEKFLAEAIESALTQTLAPCEVVVVDDGSTDGTAAVARSFDERVRLLQQQNLGAAAARNHALREVRGEFVALLDADDLMVSDRLALQHRLFAENPALDAVFGQQIYFRGDVCDAASLLSNSDARKPVIAPGGMLCRTALFARVGLFDPAQRIGEFLLWFTEAQRQGLAYATPSETVIFRRIHDSNFSRVAAQSRDGYTQQIKLLLDRRRRGAA